MPENSTTPSPAILARTPDASQEDWHAISRLVVFERYCRDNAMWDAEEACFSKGDTRVTTSWFNGPASEFIAASRTMYERSGTQRLQTVHQMHPQTIRVYHDRGLVESYGAIMVRATLKGVLVDIVNNCRFFSRVKKEDNAWKIVTFDGIYGKDRIDPVHPGETLSIDWDEVKDLRPSYRYMAYNSQIAGYPVHMEHLGEDRHDLLEPFYTQAYEWLIADRA